MPPNQFVRHPGDEHQRGAEVIRAEQIQDDAQWGGLDAAAKLDLLRAVLRDVINRSDAISNDLRPLLNAFADADGKLHLKKSLHISENADIVVD